MPDVRQHDAHQSAAAVPQDRSAGEETQGLKEIGNHSELGIFHQQEHHTGDGGRDDQRQSQKAAQDAEPRIVGIDQQGDDHAQHELNREADAGVKQGHPERAPHAAVFEKRCPVLYADKDQCALARHELMKAQVDIVEEGIEGEDDQDQDQRQQPWQWAVGNENARCPKGKRRHRHDRGSDKHDRRRTRTNEPPWNPFLCSSPYDRVFTTESAAAALALSCYEA